MASSQKQRGGAAAVRGGLGGTPRGAQPLPPAADTNIDMLVQMQARMADMQSELQQLRTAVRHSELRTSIGSSRKAAAAIEPLSVDEKRHLCEMISQLDEAAMDEVVTLIQEALPAGSKSDSQEDDGELEVPLDDLDTATLRRLQDLVRTSLAGPAAVAARQKKRSTSGAPSGRTPRGGGGAGGAGKKRKTAAPAANPIPSFNLLTSSTSVEKERTESLGDLDLFMTEDDEDDEGDQSWAQPALQRSASAPQSGSGRWDGAAEDAESSYFGETQRRIEANEKKLLESARASAVKQEQYSSAGSLNSGVSSADQLSQREEERRARMNAAFPSASAFDEEEDDDEFS